MAPKRKRPLAELSLPNIPASKNKLVEFPFNWNLKPTLYDQQKKCSVSKLTINAEWSLVCLWSNHLIIPQFLEICRNSTAKEITVSGTFKLWRDSECALQRKFIQLIEAGFECATTQVEFKYSTTSNISCSYNSNYSMTGTLTIPAGHANYSKGVQFESLLNLSSDFECLLDPKASYFSDVSLKCGTVSLSAHKNILSARSPVFAAMFATQMKESRLHKVDITDISPHVLKTILTYLYTGKIRDISAQSVGELLYAADKYELLDLKRLCNDYLKTCVSAQNILNTLVLGYLHDQDLKGFAMDYICNTCEEFEILEKTAEWDALREERPALAMDISNKVVKSKEEKLKHNPPAKKVKNEKPAAASTSNEVDLIQLSRYKYVTVREFRGKLIVDIREYYDKDGEMRPGKKGICLTMEQWNALKEKMESIEAAIKKY